MSVWDVRARGSRVGVSPSRGEPRNGASLVGSCLLLGSQSLIEWCHDLRGVLWLESRAEGVKEGKEQRQEGR